MLGLILASLVIMLHMSASTVNDTGLTISTNMSNATANDTGFTISTSMSNATANESRKLCLVGVFSVTNGHPRRSEIRETYLKFLPQSVDFFFILGKPKHNESILHLMDENKTYGDIIVLPTVENMNKGKSWHYFKYVVECGRNYKYIIKADDDVFLHLPNLAKKLESFGDRKSVYYGKIKHDYGLTFAYGYTYGCSWDVAKYLAKTLFPRDGAEDIVIASLVRKRVKDYYSEPIAFRDGKYSGTSMELLFNGTISVHGLKKSESFMFIAMWFYGKGLDTILHSSAAMEDWILLRGNLTGRFLQYIPYSEYIKTRENAPGKYSDSFSVVQTHHGTLFCLINWKRHFVKHVFNAFSADLFQVNDVTAQMVSPQDIERFPQGDEIILDEKLYELLAIPREKSEVVPLIL